MFNRKCFGELEVHKTTFMVKRYLHAALLSAFCFLTFSCSDDGGGGNYEPKTYNVSGKVEKGPFISGSTITMQPMDAKMQASGETYSATITDNAGNFTFGSKLFEAPFAELTANGYFFNEVDGDLSSGTLSLRALVDLSDKSTVNVNILTHLKYQRVLNLVGQGDSFKSANRQAQQELFAAFGLSAYADTDASQYSIISGTDEAAALIAVSSLILVDRSEAAVTEYLAKLCREFGQDGKFSAETETQIKDDKDKLADRLGSIKNNVVSRYASLGLDVEVKELARYFDWDGDGTAGNETLGEGETVTLETTNINAPAEGGTYTIKITSPIPVYLELQIGEDDPIFSPNLPEIYEDMASLSVSLDKSIDGDVLTLVVKPLKSRAEQRATVNIYDCLGNVVATVNIVQEGDKDASLPLLSEDGKGMVESMMKTLASGFSNYNLVEQYYHYNRQVGLVPDYVYPESGTIYDCWAKFYNFNYNCEILRRLDRQMLSVYGDILNVHSAMMYYYAVVAWGGVPYVTGDDYNPGEIVYYQRTSPDEIFSDLKNKLSKAIGELEEKRNRPLKDVNSMFLVSKDVARVLLADIYLYQHDYSNAASLLAKVINNGFYALDNSNYSKPETIDNIAANNGGEEVIFAVNGGSGTRTRAGITIQSPKLVTLMTYTDVMLSYAECMYRVGDMQSAERYLNAVARAKGVSFSGDNMLAKIADARRQLMLYSFGNFAFFKRSGLAASEYGVEDYCLLWPIPLSELQSNPNITQNPGY